MSEQKQLPAKALIASGLQNMAETGKLALPPHIPPARFLRTAMQAVQTTRGIENCDRQSVFHACAKAAADGLVLDGREAALVVRYGKNETTASYQPMYRGLLKMLRQSGMVARIEAHLVHDADEFRVELGTASRIVHVPKLRDRGEIIAAYAVCHMKDGDPQFEVMDRDQIDAIRDRSDGWRAYQAKKIASTPWATDYGEMARKTVLRRIAKYLPSSTDLPDAFYGDDDMPEIVGAAEMPAEPAGGEGPVRTKARMAATRQQAAPAAEPEDAETLGGDAQDGAYSEEEAPLG